MIKGLKSNLVLLGVMILNISCSALSEKIVTTPHLQPVDSHTDLEIRLPDRYQYLSGDFTSAIVFVRDIQKAQQFFSSLAVLNKKDRNWELGRYLDDRVDKNTQTVIESRLQQLKHLNIINSFSMQRAILKIQREAEETGAAVIYSDDNKPIDHIFALELTRSKDEQKMSMRKSIALYKAEISFQIIRMERGGATVIESGVVEGKSKRYQMWDLGWDTEKRQYKRENLRQGEEDFDVEQAYLQATCRASLLLVDKLSRSLPISAEIASHTRDYVELDIGQKQGVVPNQVFTIFTESSGKHRPFALGEVTRVYATHAELKIFKWSESHFVKDIVKEFKTENGRFNTHQEYHAASLGLPENFFAEEACLKKNAQ